MTDTSNAAFAEPWRRLWNGDLSQLDALVAEDFVAHAALLGGAGGDTLRGRAALGQRIGGMHAMMAGLVFTVDVGPVADADHLVVRWRARVTYRGGLPGLPASAAGRDVDFTGTDTLRVANGRLTEYWVNSDMLLLMQQLGVHAVSGAVE